MAALAACPVTLLCLSLPLPRPGGWGGGDGAGAARRCAPGGACRLGLAATRGARGKRADRVGPRGAAALGARPRPAGRGVELLLGVTELERGSGSRGDSRAGRKAWRCGVPSSPVFVPPRGGPGYAL